MDKQTTKSAKPAASKPGNPSEPAHPIKLPALFRKIDWLTLAFTFGAVWLVYLFTLAPEVTLEDSGELCTGSFYAGIPHPPGYPFWAIYSWFWTQILPFGNVAWRVEVGESAAAALACGLVAFMVSRGSSLLMEGIEELKGLTGKWENSICMVSGATAGLLLGFGGVIWSESVAINRISLFGVPWVMIVLLCLMRWIYAPDQRRYLFCAAFFFGICATIHQTLLVAAMGIEVVVIYAQPKLGRDALCLNGLIYIMMIVAKSQQWVPQLMGSLDNSIVAGLFHLIGIGSIVGCVILTARTGKLMTEWSTGVIALVLYVIGVGFYFYEPLAGMTNPPMQWGYPRTVEGFFHALSRGQYEKANPSDVLGDPMHFITQLGMLVGDVAHEYNWLCVFVALVPLLFFFKMQKRERTWIAGLVGIYACIGVLLIILMNPSPERQSADLIRVFFTSSHGVIAIMIGYGLALTTAYMAVNYKRFRIMGLTLGAVALLPALLALYNGVSQIFYGGRGLLAPKTVILLFLFLTGAFVLAALAGRKLIQASAPPEFGKPQVDRSLGFIYGAAALLCVAVSAALIFLVNEDSLSFSQLCQSVPRAFAPGQYSLPVLAGLLVFGVAVAFLGALAAYRNRAPLAISLGLFALLPLSSLMGHWGTSEQRNHWFGYWFGHDMFTPPFVAQDGSFSYDAKQRELAMKGAKGNLVYPEMTRDAILYGGTDPGRFCPTYMIFCESFIPHNCQPQQDQHFDRRDVYIITQNALADGTYLQYIRAHYNRSLQKDPPFFQELLRPAREREENYETNFVARLAGKLLDRPFTELGARIEARRRKEGVYPPKEMYIASNEDSQRCFQEYIKDAQERAQHDQQFPNEARLIKPGEDVKIIDSRVQVSGQIAVMSINGLLTKVMFDQNPTNEFFVEESFPLDWMYPHLTPFSVIMKINRKPLPELSDEICRRDHEFWSQYSERLIGNWITYDTSVKQIVDFIEKVYLQKNFSGFKGDRKFIRDEQAQKAFSKLRSSIAGIYAWRLGLASGSPTPPQYLPKTDAERQRMLREADFAFRQAFAFCPYSPEAVFRYINLLAATGRLEDALLVSETCRKLDPYNGQIIDLNERLRNYKKQPAPTAQIQDPLPQLENEVKANPTNFQKTLDLAGRYIQLQQNDRALKLLDQIYDNPEAPMSAVFAVAQAYLQLNLTQKLDQVLTQPAPNTNQVYAVAQAFAQAGQMPKLLSALEKLVAIKPGQPEAWYDLAAAQSMLNQPSNALRSLAQSIQLNNRQPKKTGARDLKADADKDDRFTSLRGLPGYKTLGVHP
jgi:tetratricopeptide (TPR) repeat protein